MPTNNDLQPQINALLSKLYKMGEGMGDVKGDLRDAARFLAAAVEGQAPIGRRLHYDRKKQAIQPGNLRKSISVLTFTRAKAAVFVGPRLRRSPDGYYAGWVNFGTKMQPAQKFIEAGQAIGQEPSMRAALALIARRAEKYLGKI